MQSVLITGGAGFIGQNLVHAWRAARPDDRLVVVDAMTYAANVRSLEPLIADRSIAFVKGDIRDAVLMRRLFEEHKLTRVAHLAAESHVDRSIVDPEAFLQTNVLGTFTLLRAALDAWRASGAIDRARFLHVSTDEVYGTLGRSEERRVGKECRSRCDWSSDVCSSDLLHVAQGGAGRVARVGCDRPRTFSSCLDRRGLWHARKIGRASCRERV